MNARNWAGNHRYPSEPVRPGSEDELASLIKGAAASGRTVGIVGARHSFSPIADGQVMLDLSGLPERFEVAQDRSSVRVGGAMTYSRFAELAVAEGLALANLASLPHVSIAGATTTGTHGSGSRNGCLATAITAMTLIDGKGAVRRVEGAAALAPLAIGLGVTGCCVEVELAVEPSYQMEQRVFEALPIRAFLENFDAVMDGGYSVSAFTRWSPVIDHVWIKRRVDEPDESALLVELGATPAPVIRHPIGSLPGDGCTEQLGQAGLWSERLPHFRPNAMPNAGDEVQTEYFVARSDGPAAVEALQAVGQDLDQHLMVSEIRTVAADELWMSPFHGRDSVAFHFTWGPGQAGAERAAGLVAAALATFEARPHWGKVFNPDPSIVGRYPMAGRFVAEMIDPVFANPWLERVLAVG